MSGLLSVMSDASGSLAAQTVATDVASQNLQNASTPGYSRQTAALQSNLPDTLVNGVYVGTGASVQSVTQIRNRFVESQLPAAFGQASQSQAEADALSGVNALNPDTSDGITAALGNFYASLQSLSQNPGDAGLRQAAVGQAQTLAASFNQASGGITSARTGLDSQIAGSVPQVNQDAAQIAQLNKQIRIASAGGAQPNDLLDARQAKVDDLEQLTGAVPIPDQQGDVSMALPGGTALVSGDQAATLSTLPDATNGGHLSLQVTLPGGTTASTLPDSAIGGQIGGQLQARDGALGTAESGLDQLAFNLGTSLNSLNASGYGSNGSTGNALFTLTPTASGAAAAITVTAAVAGNPALIAAASTSPVASGDATNLQAMISTQSQALAGGGTPASTLASVVSDFGVAQSSATSDASADSTALTSLTNLRASASGVSVDDEVVKLTQAQQTYQAISKVIETANEMLQSLLDIK